MTSWRKRAGRRSVIVAASWLFAGTPGTTINNIFIKGNDSLFGTAFNLEHVVRHLNPLVIELNDVAFLEARLEIRKRRVHLASNGGGHVLGLVFLAIGQVIHHLALFFLQLVLFLDLVLVLFVGFDNPAFINVGLLLSLDGDGQHIRGYHDHQVGFL